MVDFVTSYFVPFTIGLPGIPLTGPTPLTPARCLRSPYDCAEICGCQRPADDPPKGVKPIDTGTRTSKCLTHYGSFTLQETDSGTDSDSDVIPVVGTYDLNLNLTPCSMKTSVYCAM